MGKAILIEKLNDIRDRVDAIYNGTSITALRWIYEDLSKILEEYE